MGGNCITKVGGGEVAGWVSCNGHNSLGANVSRVRLWNVGSGGQQIGDVAFCGVLIPKKQAHSLDKALKATGIKAYWRGARRKKLDQQIDDISLATS